MTEDVRQRTPSPASNIDSSSDSEDQSMQLFCLRWDNYRNNLTDIFDQLLQNESFVDVTLSCPDGPKLKAHKMVLSACSPYFQSLFSDNPCQHPIVFFKDIAWSELRAIVDFMYKGEINVHQEQIQPLLKVAESLKIRGLADTNKDTRKAIKKHSSQQSSHHQRSTEKSIANSSQNDEERNNPSLGGNVEASSKKRRKMSDDQSSTSNTIEDSHSGLNSPQYVASQARRPSHSSHQTSTLSENKAAHSRMSYSNSRPEDCDLKSGIIELIREEKRAKRMESSHKTSKSDNFHQQYQQSQAMMLKYKSANVLKHQRGPVKSWQPEKMAAGIMCVLREGLTLSQAAKKYDIPYGTFVLYCTRIHTMLGPSTDGVTVDERVSMDYRPKGRGRPQRILLGSWPEDQIQNAIRSVVYRENNQNMDDPSNLGFLGFPLSSTFQHSLDNMEMYADNSGFMDCHDELNLPNLSEGIETMSSMTNSLCNQTLTSYNGELSGRSQTDFNEGAPGTSNQQQNNYGMNVSNPVVAGNHYNPVANFPPVKSELLFPDEIHDIVTESPHSGVSSTA